MLTHPEKDERYKEFRKTSTETVEIMEIPMIGVVLHTVYKDSTHAALSSVFIPGCRVAPDGVTLESFTSVHAPL